MERWQGVQLTEEEKSQLAIETSRVSGADKSGGLLGAFSSKAKNKFAKLDEAKEALVSAAQDALDLSGADDPAHPLIELDEAGGMDHHLLAYAEEMMFNSAADDLLSKQEVEESLMEVLWMPDGDDEEDDGGGAKAVSSERRKEKEEMENLKKLAESEVEQTDEDLEAEMGHMPGFGVPHPLYQSLECVFNHKNLWISTRSLDPTRIKYDFEDSRYWLAFVEPRMASQGMPEPFYAPKRLGTKTPPDRLRSMEAQIEGELSTQLQLARSSGLKTIINKSQELVEELKRGLELNEEASKGDEQAKADLLPWRRAVQSRLPAGSTFKARAFHFAYTDAKKIRKSLLAQCDYADETGDGTEFALAVRVFGFHGGICSVWVFYGLIDTNLLG